MHYSMKTVVTPLIAIAILSAGWYGFAQVQEKPKEKPAPTKKPAEVKDPDEEAIRRSAAAFSTAYKAHDAKAVAELFALKAEFTDEDGELIKGREAIQQNFAEMFNKFPDSKIEIEITSIRVLTPNIALEEGIVRGQPVPDEATNVSSYVVIHVKVDGHWLIASVSDFEADSEELTPNDHLQPLAWLVGDWLDESADSTVKSSCHWDESGNYLLIDFYLQIAGGVSASGSMRIGWDPLSGQLKSWTFDADSGYAEGLWIRIDDEWIVRSHGVNAAGKVTSGISVFRFIDNDTMTWRAYDRVVGGEPAEDIPENLIKRHAPAPAG
jgi:uncharacterized protein (TIGR02246 family)